MSAHRILIFLVVLAFAATGEANTNLPLKGGVFDPPRPAPDFALKGSNGSEVRLSKYRGKIVTLGFGYTFCPDVCPTTLVDLAQVRKKLGAAGKDLQVIYVTVDPDRDTPERLRAYLNVFDKTFIGATGTAEQLAQVRKAYGISVAKQAPEGTSAAYLIHHSSFVYLIDRAGNLRILSLFGRPVGDIVHDVKLLMK